MCIHIGRMGGGRSFVRANAVPVQLSELCLVYEPVDSLTRSLTCTSISNIYLVYLYTRSCTLTVPIDFDAML